jgi:hypothetical protein
VQYVNPREKSQYPYIVGIGSIGRFIDRNAVVVGTGISRSDADLDPHAAYISLRGPKTGARLTQLGGHDPGQYGDPALMISKLFPIARGKTNGRIALVRHYTHRHLKIDLPDHMDELNVLCSSPDEIEGLLCKIIQYELVVTSAMHIQIVCHSYRIPCVLVDFTEAPDRVHGDGIKYVDYYRGAGLSQRERLLIGSNLADIDFTGDVREERVAQEVIDQIHRNILSAIKLFDDLSRESVSPEALAR